MAETEQISITICGDGGCGKSSITLRLVKSEWSYDYDPTIEDSYSVTRTVDGRTYNLSLTDTAGQEEYRGLWAASNLKSDAFLLVYDITNADSLSNLDYFVQMIEMESEARADGVSDGKKKKKKSEDTGTPPVKIIAGNKCDLSGMRQVKSVQGLEYARRHGCGFMETSARNVVNIEETFELLVRRVAEQRALKANGGLPPPGSRMMAHQQSSSMGTGVGGAAFSEKHNPQQRLNSVDLEERPGGKKTKRGGWWGWLKCW